MIFVILGVVGLFLIIGFLRNLDMGYTFGKNIFKSSDYNLEENHKDASDFEYWNKNRNK